MQSTCPDRFVPSCKKEDPSLCSRITEGFGHVQACPIQSDDKTEVLFIGIPPVPSTAPDPHEILSKYWLHRIKFRYDIMKTLQEKAWLSMDLGTTQAGFWASSIL